MSQVTVVVVGEKLVVRGKVDADTVVEVDDPVTEYSIVVLVRYTTVVDVVYVLIELVVYSLVVDVKYVLVELPMIVVKEVVVYVIGKKSISKGQKQCSVNVQYFAQLPLLS